MNKIPYHNLNMLLPSCFTASKSDTLRTYGRVSVQGGAYALPNFILGDVRC